jgi:molybdopterin-guanine dinucleotide biosynthesis protein A
MGTSKAALPWHGSTLLRRTVGVVGRGVAGPVVVVRAPGQVLPELPGDVEVGVDEREGRGPLQGLAVGLRALLGQADVAFCCSTDLPFLHTAFVRRVVEAMDDEHDVVLPMAHGHRQPLAAAYRPGLVTEIDALLADGQLKPAFLFDRCRVLRLQDRDLVADRRLAAVDPRLDSVVNVNELVDYEQAHARPAPEVTVECFGTLARNGHRGARTVRAATIAAAARAADVDFDRHVVAAVNGDRVTRDGATPLVVGDEVTFVSADAGG